uniref:Uncharacterized protein n=1 Tax=Onchocerca volvulus TaxID=6282 RepID=A0A2K6WC45_ONCVO
MFPNSGSNLSRINLSQQAVRPVLTPEVPRLGCSSSLGTINMLSTAGGQAAVPPLIVSHTTSANLFGMRPLLPIPNSAEQIPDIHYRIRRNAVGCPRPLFSGMGK